MIGAGKEFGITREAAVQNVIDALAKEHDFVEIKSKGGANQACAYIRDEFFPDAEFAPYARTYKMIGWSDVGRRFEHCVQAYERSSHLTELANFVAASGFDNRSDSFTPAEVEAAIPSARRMFSNYIKEEESAVHDAPLAAAQGGTASTTNAGGNNGADFNGLRAIEP